MHAAVAPVPASSSDATSPAASAQKQRRRSSRSHSFSSASIVTVKRPGSLSSTSTGMRTSIPVSSQNPGESRLPTRSSREVKPSENQRRKSAVLDVSEAAANDTALNRDRWSQSTTSSAKSAGQTRRNRSSSGAVLSNIAGQQLSSRHRSRPSTEQATRSSPQKLSRSRANSLGQTASRTDSPQHASRSTRVEGDAPAQSQLDPPYAASVPTNARYSDLRITAQAVTTPISHVSSHVQPNPAVGSPESPSRHMLRTHRPPVSGDSDVNLSTSTAMNYAPTAGQEKHEAQPVTSPARHGHGHRHTRTREKMDKEKKTMLSKALEKANTAVLLDNAQNYEGALDAYSDACILLSQVLERTTGEDDRRKLGDISLTYKQRIDELDQLARSHPPASDAKHLPAPPMSDGSASPTSPMPIALPKSPQRTKAPQPVPAEPSAAKRSSFAPRLSYHNADRDSFFSKTMAAVQGSMMDQDSFSAAELGLAHALTSVGAAESEPRALRRTSAHLPPPDHAQFMPRPLSPRRPQSPQLLPQVEDKWQADIEQASAPPGEESPSHDTSNHESMTWLHTIDESGSSRTSSVHSLSSQDGLRRKHLRGLSGNTDADFDAAFDAAVEAAYNEGYEPDLESREPPTSTFQHRPNESVVVDSSDIQEIGPLHTLHPTNFGNELSDEEEERLLDEITQDFASGLGFSFDGQTKSALPRQSDSSGYSRSTWQSSQASDRATAATSLSTVAEDGTTTHTTARPTGPPSSTTSARGEAPSIPLPPAPLKSSLPQPTSTAASSVRSRRLSGQNPKQLVIETTSKSDGRKRASTFHHSNSGSPFAEESEHHALPSNDQETKAGSGSHLVSSGSRTESAARPLPTLELHSIPNDSTRPVTASAATEYRRPSYEAFPGELQSSRPTLFRKNKSSASLREHTAHTLLLASPDIDSVPSLVTPMSSTFATFVAKRNQNPLTSQRANLPPYGQAAIDGPNGSGVYLFDTLLLSKQGPSSPKGSPFSPPAGLEPCPESLLLRPFWLMRALASTLTHPRGGYLTTKLFIPREIWHTRGVKLRFVEEKIANCDLLTAALGRLASVDPYEVEAVMDELQNFEEVVERVQATLGRRLGNDVGVHGAANFFKDAAVGLPSHPDAAAASTGVDKATKSNSGKSYLSSWRKLRNKSSGAPLSGNGSSANLARQHSSTNVSERDNTHSTHSMASVPMTSFVPVERRGQKRDLRNLAFEGPHKDYMGSLARLFDGVQVLDQIARQVEDPGLKHSSPTHVGLELSTRHAAEFFAFYVCRFVLADMSTLLEKFLKKGTEWVLA